MDQHGPLGSCLRKFEREARDSVGNQILRPSDRDIDVAHTEPFCFARLVKAHLFPRFAKTDDGSYALSGKGRQVLG